MEQLAKVFFNLTQDSGISRIKVKFEKPISDGYKAEVFDGDKLVQTIESEDGHVEYVDYQNGRRDWFDKGVINRVSIRGHKLKLRFKGDVCQMDAELPSGTNFNQINLSLNPSPGTLSHMTEDIHTFLTQEDLSQYGFEKERVEFEYRNEKDVVITIGKGKNAKVSSF